MSYQNRLWNNYKSHGERQIASYLKERCLDFTYERPVVLVDDGKTKIWHPDFYLNQYHIIIEYLGMNGNAQNARLNNYKRHVYTENRYDLIEIYPEDFKGNWQDKITTAIYDTLEGRLVDYISKFRHESRQSASSRTYWQSSFRFCT
jgi:hypothetical protein